MHELHRLRGKRYPRKMGGGGKRCGLGRPNDQSVPTMPDIRIGCLASSGGKRRLPFRICPISNFENHNAGFPSRGNACIRCDRFNQDSQRDVLF